MQSQKLNNLKFVNFSQFRSILGLYFFTTGACLLGFSIYLILETLGYSTNNITTWSGQSLFWGFTLFFSSLFILFLPSEFINLFHLSNRSFAGLISNIIFTISISLLFLVFIQMFLPETSTILLEVGDLFKATSFAGFIVVPIFLFLFHNLESRFTLFENYDYSLTLLVWIFGTLFFI
jgi:hypothetical protein